jgi:hypothetical protein
LPIRASFKRCATCRYAAVFQLSGARSILAALPLDRLHDFLPGGRDRAINV